MKPFRAPLLLAIFACLFMLIPEPADAARRRARSAPAQTEAVQLQDIGVLKNADIHVVQNMLHGPRGRPELQLGIGVSPFDPYVTGISGHVGLGIHIKRRVGLEIRVQGGYGLGTLHWREVSALRDATPGLIGLGADARRTLLSANVSAMLTPVYGKFSLGARRVVHFDWYFLVGGVFQLGQGIDAGGTLGPGGGIGLGTGVKLWARENLAVRFEVRDNLIIEQRTYTGDVTVRNDWNIGMGVSIFLGGQP